MRCSKIIARKTVAGVPVKMVQDNLCDEYYVEVESEFNCTYYKKRATARKAFNRAVRQLRAEMKAGY